MFCLVIITSADPHFYTWGSMWYDYHGGCDIVLINNALLDLHVATEPMVGYAGISKVVVKMHGSGKKLEIQDNGDTYVDGVFSPLGVPSLFDGYTVDTTTSGSGDTYKIELSSSPLQFISINRWSYNLDVQVQAHGSLFAGSKGMCGSWNSGGVKKRDGSTFPAPDPLLYADEWQVQAGEHHFEAPFPAVACSAPPTCGKDLKEDLQQKLEDGETAEAIIDETESPCGRTGGRKLRSSCRKTCDDIDAVLYPEHKLNCLFDVIVTGKRDFACMPSYAEPLVIRPCNQENTICAAKGGKCVHECKKTKEIMCEPNMCAQEGEPNTSSNCVCALPPR